MKKAFSLIELMIVVAIIGIVAAILIPEFTGHTAETRETAAKDNLRAFRNIIEFYSAQHNGIPPGYTNGNTSVEPEASFVVAQLTSATNKLGQWAAEGTPGYDYGPYVTTMPENPFNGHNSIYMVTNAGSFPSAEQDGAGWLYHAAKKAIRLNTFGTDSEGMDYQDY